MIEMTGLGSITRLPSMAAERKHLMTHVFRQRLLGFTYFLAVALASSIARAAEVPAKPNVVLIMADDLGYGDLSCYGATVIATPHCDRLAREGRRFTDAHAPSSSCSPTRFGLL